MAEPGWLTWPNALTALRALLVPVILVLLRVGSDAAAWWAFGVFLFAAATDTIDGWAARRWQGVTRWGQLADPIADKLLIIGTLMTLAALGPLPWWAVIVIVVREVAVTVLRIALVRNAGHVMPASVWGKAKTVAQVAAVAAFLLPRLPESVQLGLLYVAVALTVISGLDYALRAQRMAARTQAAEGA